MTWPKLSIAADQGSDILSGIFALQRHYKINLDYTPDVSHGVQNDLWAAGRECGLAQFMYMVLLLVNVPMGPWCEDMRYKQVVQALDDLLSTEEAQQCPLFMSLVADMQMEAPVEPDHTTTVEMQIWNELKTSGPWMKKGTKTSKSRFLSLLRAGKNEVSMWSRRLFGYLFAAIELDAIQPKAFVKLKVHNSGVVSLP